MACMGTSLLLKHVNSMGAGDIILMNHFFKQQIMVPIEASLLMNHFNSMNAGHGHGSNENEKCSWTMFPMHLSFTSLEKTRHSK